MESSPSPRDSVLIQSVLIQDEGDQTFAFDIDTGEAFELNASAATILRGAREGRSPLEIVQDLMASLTEPTPEALILQDVEETLLELRSLGLLA